MDFYQSERIAAIGALLLLAALAVAGAMGWLL